MSSLRGRLTGLRDRWVDQSLLRVARARDAISRGRADLLVLGESSCLSWAYADTDRTLLPELVARRTGASVVTVAGAGFDARMYDAVLAVLARLDRRPAAVVAAINIRTNTALHVTRHPTYGTSRQRAALARSDGRAGRIRAYGPRSMPTPVEVADFRALPMTTRWGLAGTVGGYLERLQGAGPPPWPVDLERLRFDYFHGEVVRPDNGGLDSLRALARRLHEYGVPVVAYWAQPPVARGEHLFPGEFTSHVEANLAQVAAALAEGGLAEGLLRPALEPADFQDERNGTEHYALRGRQRIAGAIAEAVIGRA